MFQTSVKDSIEKIDDIPSERDMISQKRKEIENASANSARTRFIFLAIVVVVAVCILDLAFTSFDLTTHSAAVELDQQGSNGHASIVISMIVTPFTSSFEVENILVLTTKNRQP